MTIFLKQNHRGCNQPLASPSVPSLSPDPFLRANNVSAKAGNAVKEARAVEEPDDLYRFQGFVQAGLIMMPRFVEINAPRPGLPSSALQVQSPLTLSEMASWRDEILNVGAAASVVESDRSVWAGIGRREKTT